MSFGDVESNVGNRIAFQFIDEWNNIRRNNIHRNNPSKTLLSAPNPHRTYRNREQNGHTIEIIRTIRHLQHSWQNRDFSPFRSKLPRQTLQIDCRGFTNRVDWIAKPIHG